MKNYVIVLLLLTNILNGFELEQQKKPLKVLIIPGQNGFCPDKFYVNERTGIVVENINRVETPMDRPSIDLGQSGCMNKFENALKSNDDEFIIYANSQGTATALNFFSKNSAHAGRCKGMVLESVLASGNSAIYHTITSLLGLPKLKWVPWLYYLAPYLAKMVAFPSYSPRGEQPIKSITDLNIDGPVIIAHSEKDPQLSYDDARAIYYALRKNNKDAYLISRKEMGHINILGGNSTVKSILGQSTTDELDNKSDISQYQPDMQDHKVAYDELMKKEQTIMKYGPWPICLMTAGVVVGFAAIIKRLFSKKIIVA